MLGCWTFSGQPFQPALACSNCLMRRWPNSRRPFSVLGTKFFLKDFICEELQRIPQVSTCLLCVSHWLSCHSVPLLEFDQIRTSLKSRTVKLPSELHKHKKLAWYFHKQVCRQKAHLEELLDRDVPELAMSGQYSHFKVLLLAHSTLMGHATPTGPHAVCPRTR